MDHILEALQKVSLFTDFPEDALQDLSHKVESLSLPADTILFKEGDPGEDMYIIVHGQISISGIDAQGNPVLFDELIPGEYFGEMSLLEKKPRSASARTVSQCELLKLNQPDFLNVLNQYPSLALKLASDFSARLRSSSEILEHVNAPEEHHQVTIENVAEQRVRVFVSYSRRDKEFVRKLHEGLVANGFETWVDWEGIPLGTDWWQEIVEGIQGCDNFLFVITPDSVDSKVCGDELQTAIANNKRLVPVLFREEPGMVAKIRAELQAINFTFMRTDDEFQKLLPDLVNTLSTDVEHLKIHTRLQNLSLEWDRKKRTSNLTLRGDELENAEGWLARSGGKQPTPSEIQGEFIQASRKDANRRQRQFLTSVVVALIITIILAVLAALSYIQAEQSRQVAEVNKNLAETAQVIAQDKEALAILQQATAEAASTKAINEQEIAEREANAASTAEAKAVEQREEANQQRGIAEEQRQIADAQRLASQAEGDLSRGNLLTRSILLAIASMHKNRNYQADLSLRVGLDLLPSMLYRENLDVPIVKGVYSEDGALLAIGQQDGKIQVWDSIYGNVIAEMAHDAVITDMVFTPDGSKLATASEDSTARVWDPTTGEELFRLQHQGAVLTIAMSPNGYWLASGGEDQYARTWNLRSGKEVANVYHTGAVLDVEFSPGGSWVASVGKNKAAILWNPTTGAVFSTLYHEDELNLVLFGPDARWMATAQKGGTVTIWNPGSQAKIAQFSHEQDVVSMARSPDGELLITGSLDQTARVWEPLTGRALTQLRHERQVLTVAFSSNGQWVATGSGDNTARVWDPRTGREIARMEHDNSVTTLAFTPNGLLLTTGSRDQSVRVWSPEAVGQAILSLQHPAPVIDLDFNPDETRLATAGGDRIVRIWDVDTASVILRIPADGALTSAVIDVDFSRDGKFVATGSADSIARVWDATTGEEVVRFAHEASVLDVDFSRDGLWLVTGSEDTTARIWSLETGELLHTFKQDGVVGEVNLRTDGSQLATASLDKTARIWDIETEAEVQHLEHPAGVTLVNFISQTNWLVTVSQDNVIRFWDDTTGDLIDRFFVDSQIRAIEISSDGSKLAVTGDDNIARVWDIVSDGTGVSLQEVSRVVHLGIINDVVFAAEGNRIATASNDRTVLISLLIPEELIEKACARLARNFSQLEWTQFFEGDVYQLTCPELPPHQMAISALKTEVGKLGEEGAYTDAVALMRHIQAIDSSTEYDLAKEIQRLTVESIINSGRTFAQEGVFEEAYSKYGQVQAFAGYENAPDFDEFIAEMCTIGGTETSAERTLPLCDTAIAIFPDNYFLYEARARVQAWLGSFETAIADLEQAGEMLGTEELSEEDQALLTEWARWIEALRSGINPFTELPPS